MYPINEKQIFYCLQGQGVNPDCLLSTENKIKHFISHAEYIRIDTSHLAKPLSPGTLVVAGGNMREQLNSLSSRQDLKDFVSNGHKYIGICAGAYLGLKCKLVDSTFNLSSASDPLNQKLRVRPIEVSQSLVKGISSFSAIYFGGPEFKPSFNEESLASFSDNFEVSAIGRPSKILLTSYHWEFEKEFDFQKFQGCFSESITAADLTDTVKNWQTTSDQVIKSYLNYLNLQ